MKSSRVNVRKVAEERKGQVPVQTRDHPLEGVVELPISARSADEWNEVLC